LPTVSFRIPWMRIETRIFLEGKNLGDVSTLTVSGTQSLACSVEGYSRRMWPSVGPGLVRFLQDEQQFAWLSDGTKIYLHRGPPHFQDLEIVATGSASSVAECGEFLGWMAAAVGARESPISTGPAISFAKPSLKLLESVVSVSGEYYSRVVFQVQVFESVPGVLPPMKTPLQLAPYQFCVRGYPVPPIWNSVLDSKQEGELVGGHFLFFVLIVSDLTTMLTAV
jgi:hypothetical protein